MKKLLNLVLLVFPLVTNARGIFGTYRSVKRDINTAHEIAGGGGGYGLLILFVIVLIILIPLVIVQMAKQARIKKEVLKNIKDFEQKNPEVISAVPGWTGISSIIAAKDPDKSIVHLNYILAVHKKDTEARDLSVNGLTISNLEELIRMAYDGTPAYLNEAIEKLKHFKKLKEKYGEEKGGILFDQKYYIGMTKEELIDSKNSEPDKIEIEKLKTKTKELYIYGNKSSGDVFVFENEILARFKDR